MAPFVPLFRNPHLQTIAGHYWRRPDSAGGLPVERRLYRTEPDVQVLVESQRPSGKAAGELVMVHGLEGDSQAGYMLGLSSAALRAGFAAHRFNLRACGGTQHLCRTLYHGGLTSDLLAVLRQMQAEGRAPVYLAGFSLGGNVVVKLACELGESARGLVHGVCAISASIDLASCARRIAQPDNRLYEMRFVRRMRARLLATGRYSRQLLAGLSSVQEIDDRITAPSFGFGTAANYYRTQSAVAYMSSLRAPVLFLQAKDDTFVPYGVFETEAVRRNPWVEVVATEYGGHLGFLGRSPRRFWVDDAVTDWITARR